MRTCGVAYGFVFTIIGVMLVIIAASGAAKWVDSIDTVSTVKSGATRPQSSSPEEGHKKCPTNQWNIFVLQLFCFQVAPP